MKEEHTVVAVRGGLNAMQIAWLRTHVPNFDYAWQAVAHSQNHVAHIRAQLDRHTEVPSFPDGDVL